MLLLIFFAFLSDNLTSLLISLAALTLHELCHALMARALGYTIGVIDLEPFGFVARLEERVLERWDELLIAAAGPLFSLVAGVAFLAFKGAIEAGFPAFEEFGRANLLIAAVNFLPALPLDGGRAAKAGLSGVWGERTAVRLLSSFGMAAGVLFLLLGIWMLFNGQTAPILLLWGVFLPLAAFREWRSLRVYRLSAMVKRAGNLKSGGAAAVRFMAVSYTLRAKDALRLFSFDRYVALYVVDGGMKKLGELDENTLLEGIAALGQEATLADILGRFR
ncbi:MAG TPA: site-2 protease family protein [Clostridia bacterium]|nr:site-2 protease family protein [Clostridia bacterium]